MAEIQIATMTTTTCKGNPTENLSCLRRHTGMTVQYWDKFQLKYVLGNPKILHAKRIPTWARPEQHCFSFKQKLEMGFLWLLRQGLGLLSRFLRFASSEDSLSNLGPSFL